MSNARTAAVQHVRVMEGRLAKQVAVVERLRAAGEDTTEQLKKLKLLRLALDEMLAHCGRLMPSTSEMSHSEKMAPLLPSRSPNQK